MRNVAWKQYKNAGVLLARYTASRQDGGVQGLLGDTNQGDLRMRWPERDYKDFSHFI